MKYFYSIGTAFIITIACSNMTFGQNFFADSSFETGTPNIFWDEFSSNFAGPICQFSICGDCGGTCVPRTGTFFAWMGGFFVLQIASVGQSVFIPVADSAYMNFWLKISGTNGTGGDSIKVIIDSTDIVFGISALDSAAYQNYTEVGIDLTAYGDNSFHYIQIWSIQRGMPGVVTNFLVDDVSLRVKIGSGLPCVVDAGNDKSICSGDTIQIGGIPTADFGTPPYTYNWFPAGSIIDPTQENPEVFPDSTTSYTVCVTDLDSCNECDTVTVFVIQTTPVADFTMAASGLSVQFSNTSTDADAYQWRFGDGDTSTQVDPIHVYSNSGSYNISLVAFNNCDTNSVQTDTTSQGIMFVSVYDHPDEFDPWMFLYPNPADDILTVELSLPYQQDLKFQIYDSIGQKLFEKEIRKAFKERIVIDLSQISPGIYLVRLYSEHKIITNKLVISK